MIRAVIDIGTNSVRLLIAQQEEGGEWKTLKKNAEVDPSGRGNDRNGENFFQLADPHASGCRGICGHGEDCRS